jgi:predicted ribosomally synthesized peptide with nif11-like leader
MTKSTIDEFFTQVKSDEALNKELVASQTEEAFFLTAVRRGAERGYTFTVDEVRKASREGQIGSELSEEVLAGVAGGLDGFQKVTSWNFCTWTWLGC